MEENKNRNRNLTILGLDLMGQAHKPGEMCFKFNKLHRQTSSHMSELINHEQDLISNGDCTLMSQGVFLKSNLCSFLL